MIFYDRTSLLTSMVDFVSAPPLRETTVAVSVLSLLLFLVRRLAIR
jgi:hypothetical protein